MINKENLLLRNYYEFFLTLVHSRLSFYRRDHITTLGVTYSILGTTGLVTINILIQNLFLYWNKEV